MIPIGFYSCGKDSRCGKSTGEIQSFQRDLPAFGKMAVHDKIDIELKPSSVNRVTITCGKNLVDYIVTEVKGDELIIRNNNACNFLRSYKKELKIVVEYTRLWRINFIGAGLVSSTDTLKQPYLEVEGEGCSGDFEIKVKMDSIRFTLHTGNTNVTLTGEAGRAYFYSGGTSHIRAREMITGQCFANNSGSGDFNVNAINYLFAVIGQQGSIFYNGNPSVDKDIKGSGQLVHD